MNEWILEVDGKTVDTSKHWFPTPEKTRKFLVALLNGQKTTTIDTLLEFNLQTPNARASELRSMGWAIRTGNVRHPKLEGEVIKAYYMDVHFLNWWRQHTDIDPFNYGAQDGRGKFATEEAS